MLLIDKDTVGGISPTFEVSGQITIFASHLAGSDYVELELVDITPAKTPSGDCPPYPVILPAVVWSAPLKCCDEPIKLTPDQPYVLVDHPQNVKLRAKLVTSDVGWSDKRVWFKETSVHNPNDRMRGCPC